MMTDLAKEQRFNDAINEAIDYFRVHNKKSFITAIQNACSRVRIYESGNISIREYKPNVNRCLCESLWYMNSDPNCSSKCKKTVRKILESYRQMNGLSTDDFTNDVGEDLIVNINKDSKLVDELSEDEFGDEISKYILDNTQRGLEYEIEVVIGEILKLHPEYDNIEEKLQFENEIYDKIKELISFGYFEVTDRDYMDGKITVILKIR